MGPIHLAAELVNSAVEAVVDMVSPEWNLRARGLKRLVHRAFEIWFTKA